MCGRTVCSFGPKCVRKLCSRSELKLRKRDGDVMKDERSQGLPLYCALSQTHRHVPSYNQTPGSHCAVLVSSQHPHVSSLKVNGMDTFTTSADDKVGYVVQCMLWGLLPSWHKGTIKEFGLKLNNTRVESLHKPMFKALLARRRCVVVVDGFYEWKTENGKKQAYFFHSKENENIYNDLEKEKNNIEEEDAILKKKETIVEGMGDSDATDQSINNPTQKDYKENPTESRKLLTMAGLFDSWTSRDNEVIYSFSIITVQAETSPISSVHHRMPALLKGEEIEEWLDCKTFTPEQVLPLLRETDHLGMYAVSNKVNNSKENTLDCLKPIDLNKIVEEEKGKKRRNDASANMMEAWLKKAKMSTKMEKGKDK